MIPPCRGRALLAIAILASLLAHKPASVLAQSTLASEPVGIAATTLLGNSDTLISIPFTRSPEFVGGIQSISGNVITVMGTPGWTNNQFVYAAGTQPKHFYLLIGRSGTANPKEGHTYPITGNGSNTLTVDTTLDSLSGIPANTQIVLIPFWTLATVFPASDQNVSFTPTTSTLAYKTQVRIPDNTAASTNPLNSPFYFFNIAGSPINPLQSPIYFFSNNVDGTSSNVGWRIVGDNTTDHGDDVLQPSGSFVIRNQNASPTLPLTSLGTVLTKKLAVPLKTATTDAQDNAVSILRPFDVALDASGLGPADGSFVANDQLLLFNNAQVGFDKPPSTVYYYDTTVGNSGGWRLTGDSATDRGNDVILAGTGFVVRKVATAGGQSVFWTNATPVAALSAVSRKIHGSAGTFDVNLPLTGTPGIECRLGQGGNSDQHQIVITFPTPVTFSSAAVTSGTGSVGSTSGNGTTTIIVSLAGVANAHWLTFTLLSVSDGTNTNDVAVRMGVLVGDVNGDGGVSNLDVSLVKAKVAAGAMVDSSNFRDDVNADGGFSNLDISITKAQVAAGAQLPPP